MFEKLLRSLHAVHGSMPVVRAVIQQAVTKRSFGSTGIQLSPCRYDDPNDVIRKILTQKRLDRCGFDSWQALINHCATNGDKPSVYAAFHLAKHDDEKIVIPPIGQPGYIQGLHRLADVAISNVELNHFEDLHKSALKCIELRKVDGEYFKSREQLADYFLDIDDSRNAQAAYGLNTPKKKIKVEV